MLFCLLKFFKHFTFIFERIFRHLVQLRDCLPLVFFLAIVVIGFQHALIGFACQIARHSLLQFTVDCVYPCVCEEPGLNPVFGLIDTVILQTTFDQRQRKLFVVSFEVCFAIL